MDRINNLHTGVNFMRVSNMHEAVLDSVVLGQFSTSRDAWAAIYAKMDERPGSRRDRVAGLRDKENALPELARQRVGMFEKLLETIPGENGERPGLLETPYRVAKAWSHWFGGYEIDVASLLKTFEDGAEGANQMVMVKDIPVYSKCEHHLADIIGTATVAYIPDGRIVGLSKLNRVVDAYMRRLQVQERLTNQIADAIEEHLKPLGVGVILKARHMCMESRGVCQHGHHTRTQALRGVFMDDATVRAEFMAAAT